MILFHLIKKKEQDYTLEDQSSLLIYSEKLLSMARDTYAVPDSSTTISAEYVTIVIPIIIKDEFVYLEME